MIYNHAFTANEERPERKILLSSQRFQGHPGFQLLRVCRQIYSDVFTMPYSMFAFELDTAFFPLENWLARLKRAQREAIREIGNKCIYECEWLRDGVDGLLQDYKDVGRRLAPQLEWTFGPMWIVGKQRDCNVDLGL